MKKAFKRISVLILVVAMFAIQSIGFAAIKDINGADIPGWNMVVKDSEGYVELVSDVVYSGNNAMHVVKTSPKDGSQKYINISNNAPVENGKTYVYGCWIKADKAMQINMYFTDNGMENMSSLGHTWDWKKVEFKVTSTKDNTAQAIGFMCYGAAKNIWIDDVFVYELDSNGNYVGTNLIANNPNFEGSKPAGGTATSAAPDERVVIREKDVSNAQNYLSVSKELPMFKKNIIIDGELTEWNDLIPVEFLRYYKMKDYK